MSSDMKNRNVQIIEYGDLNIDINCRQVKKKGKIIALRRKEFDILILLTEHPGWVYTKEQIFESVCHFHQLRNTYATILLKNSFNSKGVSHLLGHAKEIISVDVYGDTQEIIEDCLDVLEPFIEEVIPKERKDQYYDYSEVIEIDLILKEYFHAA